MLPDGLFYPTHIIADAPSGYQGVILQCALSDSSDNVPTDEDFRDVEPWQSEGEDIYNMRKLGYYLIPDRRWLKTFMKYGANTYAGQIPFAEVGEDVRGKYLWIRQKFRRYELDDDVKIKRVWVELKGYAAPAVYFHSEDSQFDTRSDGSLIWTGLISEEYPMDKSMDLYLNGFHILQDGTVDWEDAPAITAVLLNKDYIPNLQHSTFEDISEYEIEGYDRQLVINRERVYAGSNICYTSSLIDFGSATYITADFLAFVVGAPEEIDAYSLLIGNIPFRKSLTSVGTPFRCWPSELGWFRNRLINSLTKIWPK